MHAGIPSLSGGAGGPTVYHSNYDSFEYYQRFVDPEFQMGPMVEKMAGIMALRLANGTLIPYNLNRYATDLQLHFDNATAKIQKYQPDFNGFTQAQDAITQLKITSQQLTIALDQQLSSDMISTKKRKAINRQLLDFEKSFLSQKGMYFGRWYQSLYASSDPFSGYAAWILPGLEYEIALQATNRLEEWDRRYTEAILLLNQKMQTLTNSL